jgi:hypothetical protein
MPAADEMEVLLKHLVDLAPLGAFVGSIGVAGAAVVSPRARDVGNRDNGEINPCEQETAGLPLPEARLPVPVEMSKHVVVERDRLSGMTDVERDHAARILA